MWRLWVFGILLVIGYFWTMAEYEAVKKYYPNLTMWEYFILNDKLRITPNGE